MTTSANSSADGRPRRTNLSRLRTAAAGSVLAAVSITGVGAAAVPAQAAELRSFLAPPLDLPDGAAEAAGFDTSVRSSSERRLLGIREELANAVAWGSVTQQQADRFYAQMQSRIARGL